STPTQQQLLTEEALVFTDDHLRDPVQQDRPTAHRARRERGVEHRLGVDARRLSAGVLECVHLAMANGTALLHAAVVTAPDDPAPMDDDRADGNATLRQSLLRLGNAGSHEGMPGFAPF